MLIPKSLEALLRAEERSFNLEFDASRALELRLFLATGSLAQIFPGRRHHHRRPDEFFFSQVLY